MSEIAPVVAEIVQIAPGLAGAYLTVGLVLAAVQGQLGSVAGVPHAVAYAAERRRMLMTARSICLRKKLHEALAART